MARLATILSFGDHAQAQLPHPQQQTPPPAPEEEEEEEERDLFDDAASDGSADSFEFAFAPPLTADGASLPAPAPADDIFAHGRILPAYPVFSFNSEEDDARGGPAFSATAPPSPDTCCAWAPRSAPGSPARERAFPKSASTGQKTVSFSTAASPGRFRLRDLLGSNGRSHSDGKDKFLFIQPKPKPAAAAAQAAPAPKKKKKQGGNGDGGNKKKAATEMDMATAHRLFYSKPGGPQQHAQALPYRTGIVGFFAAAHALRRPQHNHPY
ncbi:uncharacterized protein LOC100836156 [Brachypodium distachyon]|uniref:Uncharacterized protein n=1 Tax=Brachypodium distachyon TaxID=15368 RepID=I1HWX5_BRADI|nr:uncharacterized protein LOC100836156 [Brachypodium distachyon]KQJ93174.1 hypothetical protein BRADI_3g03070v3 [Brachypodium distachyon]|eukprot:XP_003570889.1 uncharacterized protein LOC100836156 [Brachypodium distachyon]